VCEKLSQEKKEVKMQKEKERNAAKLQEAEREIAHLRVSIAERERERDEESLGGQRAREREREHAREWQEAKEWARGKESGKERHRKEIEDVVRELILVANPTSTLHLYTLTHTYRRIRRCTECVCAHARGLSCSSHTYIHALTQNAKVMSHI